MGIIENIKKQIKGKGLKIVFPEGNDWRVLGAAIRLKEDGLVEPVIIGTEAEVLGLAKENGKSAEDLTIIDPKKYDEMDDLLEEFLEVRKGKIEEEEAKRLLLEDTNYFGILLLQTDKVDGFVSGATRSTGDTVRPALQIIRSKEGYTSVSGLAILIKEGEEDLIFSDIAINIDPSAEELAQIALITAQTARDFGIDPRVAMLSFSTKGSAKSDGVYKVARAARLAKEMDPDLKIDGELQFDAAVVETVAKLKAPGSEVAGNANVFIFPEIAAGNIAYKVAERLGGYEAVGPILQGINKPVNDLSRGADQDDVYNLSLITAIQALEN